MCYRIIKNYYIATPYHLILPYLPGKTFLCALLSRLNDEKELVYVRTWGRG